MVNDLRKKSNKELCDLIIKLKGQLLEYRFRAVAGQLDKTHKVKIVKKTIAVSFSILSERNVDLSISSHDYAMIELKDGKRITTSLGRGILTADSNLLKEPSKKDDQKQELGTKADGQKQIKPIAKIKPPKVKKAKTAEPSKPTTGSDSASKKAAPKKIVTKSTNTTTKKSTIVKKAQRGI
ncbi:MAG: 50S ribosomal protein L29 [Mycoplasmoidaceae bacterium]